MNKILPLYADRIRKFWAPLAAIALIAIVYACIACTADSEFGARNNRDAYYNLMVQGWLQGKLSLALDAPAGLRALPDPYDPKANAQYRGLMYCAPRIHDLSYFDGKLYFYFSPIPAVVAFLPFHLITGGWLSHQQGCLLFCLIGYSCASILVWSLRDHFFKGVGNRALAVALFGLGILSLGPVLLQHPDVWEVPISCANAGWMLALLLVWYGMMRPAGSRALMLLAATSAALAIGSRPSSVVCGIILLVPFARFLRHEGKARWPTRLGAALNLLLPLLIMGGGLLAYNHARFGDCLEFGQRYQLTDDAPRGRSFDLAFVPYHAQVYALAYCSWGGHFPFIKDAILPTPPPGHGGMDHPFGLFTNLPAMFFSLALLLGGWTIPAAQRRPFFLVLATVFAGALAMAAPLLMYFGACIRYEFEFAGFFAILAVLGSFCGEALSPGWARGLLRAFWYLLLATSVAFSLLTTVSLRARALEMHGASDLHQGRWEDAIARYEEALHLMPDDARVHNDLGYALAKEPGRLNDAIGQYQEALRLKPDLAEAHNGLGTAWLRLPDHLDDAVAEFQEALRFNPEYAEAHNNYAVALVKLPGRLPEALAHFEQALRIDPDFASAHSNLAFQLEMLPGRLPEAVAHYEQAVRIKPDDADAQNDLAVALAKLPGRLPDAVAHFEQALRINPTDADLHYNLANQLSRLPGRLPEAIAHYEEALRIRPDFAAAHFNLAVGDAKVGRYGEAIRHLERVLALDPTNGPAREILERLQSAPK